MPPPAKIDLVRGRKMWAGFTLVELLTVVSIMAVCTALLLPVASRMRLCGESCKCAANLRQIGAGILAYTQENDGTLPGPLKIGVFPWWTDTAALSWRLQKYLELDPTRWKRRDDVFICPAYLRVVRSTSDVPDYMLNALVPMRDVGSGHQPVGYPDAMILGTNTMVSEREPMKLSQLGDIVDSQGIPAAAGTWALKDADALDPLLASWSYGALLPKKMVHETHRNALFYDFHVGPLDALNHSM